MISMQQKLNHNTMVNGFCSLRLHLCEELTRYQHMNSDIYTYVQLDKTTDSHKLACFVDFAIHFDGGKRRPGVLHLSGHLWSCNRLLEAQELHLLV